MLTVTSLYSEQTKPHFTFRFNRLIQSSPDHTVRVVLKLYSLYSKYADLRALWGFAPAVGGVSYYWPALLYRMRHQWHWLELSTPSLDDMSVPRYMVPGRGTVIGIKFFTALNFCGRNGFVRVISIISVDEQHFTFISLVGKLPDTHDSVRQCASSVCLSWWPLTYTLDCPRRHRLVTCLLQIPSARADSTGSIGFIPKEEYI